MVAADAALALFNASPHVGRREGEATAPTLPPAARLGAASGCRQAGHATGCIYVKTCLVLLVSLFFQARSSVSVAKIPPNSCKWCVRTGQQLLLGYLITISFVDSQPTCSLSGTAISKTKNLTQIALKALTNVV